MNYKFLNSAGDWRKGDVVTDKEINDTNLGGVQRLLDLKTAEATDEARHVQTEAANSPDNTKGDNVEVNSDDDVDKRAERRAEAVGEVNNGKRTLGDKPVGSEGDAAAAASPSSGRPGTVIRTTGAPAKK